MKNVRFATLLRALTLILLTGLLVESISHNTAEARAGMGRSSGRSFGGFGSRQSSPPPSNNNYNNRSYPSPAMDNQPARGGFLRNMAGGVAGGFLGSMLFNSVGNAGGYGANGGGGGMGLFEIMLLGGIMFFAFRWWKNRQLAEQSMPYSASTVIPLRPNVYTPQLESPSWNDQKAASVAITIDTASDIFFRVQGAWTRRDLSPLKDLLGAEIIASFERDITDLRSRHQINRLENIAVRQAEVTESWNDDNLNYSTVSFRANLLDYTVNETTSAVIDGSDSVPVKFQEDWTFAKANTSSQWQLVKIDVI